MDSDSMDDQVKDYEETLHTTIKYGFQSLLMAVGCKLKLFDYLADETEPRNSHEIADLAGLKERYIREWLNGMVVSCFIKCDPSGQKYWLPTAAKHALTSRTGKIACSLYETWSHMITVFDKICECFQLDGPRGLPYSKYGDIHEAITKYTSQWQDPALIDHIIPSIPELKEKLDRGITCLDIGCGLGVIPMLLAQHFPRSQFYGLDIVPDAIETCVKRAQEKGLSNVQFLLGDAKQLPADWTSKFEYVTACDAIHDIARADLALKEIHRVLKSAGQFSMLDADTSSNVYENIRDHKAIVFYAVSLFHCMPISNYSPDGLGLGLVMGKEKAVSMLKEAGFGKIELIDQPWDTYKMNAHFLCTKTADHHELARGIGGPVIDVIYDEIYCM